MKKIILACLLIPFMFSSANADETIGTVNKIKTYAYGTRVEQKREPLFTRDDAHQNQVIETVKGGAAWLIFKDDTELFISGSSRLTLDEFVYDGNNDSMIVDLTTGVFRFITGAIAPEKIKITTPVATIGIRGTDIEITVNENGTLIATAFEGVISVYVPGLVVQSDGCQTIELFNSSLVDIRPCPPSGPSIGPFTFAVSHGGGGSSFGSASSEPGGSSEGPDGNDGPSGGPGNGNGNAGNPGNGGGNINGSGPGTGNNGQNNGQGNGASNGGGGSGK